MLHFIFKLPKSANLIFASRVKLSWNHRGQFNLMQNLCQGRAKCSIPVLYMIYVSAEVKPFDVFFYITESNRIVGNRLENLASQSTIHVKCFCVDDICGLVSLRNDGDTVATVVFPYFSPRCFLYCSCASIISLTTVGSSKVDTSPRSLVPMATFLSIRLMIFPERVFGSRFTT